MKQIKGGITAPLGFQAAGIACGLKRSGKPDLALIYSEVPATAAGVFTTNQVKAAPVLVSQQQLKSPKVQAIIANAGNANCWTGQKGLDDAWEMVHFTAKALGLSSTSVLVASTGVIGQPLPIEKIKPSIYRLAGALSRTGGSAAAQAILTTDTKVKEIAVKIGRVTLAGIAKGSGMIAPGLATMFAFITTDAKIGRAALQKMLKVSVAKSFNMVSVDNCQSTNDCVFALANGLSGVGITRSQLPAFQKALDFVCEFLAKAIARDGEGASKMMTVSVKGAASQADARAAVKALIGSFLLKAAVYGRDTNTGRILQALGATQIKVNWPKIKFNWQMGPTEDQILVNLAAGNKTAVGWGCDLTEGYVKINADYHT